MRALTVATFVWLMCLALAQKTHAVDYNQMIGEWSERGKCEASRFVFTKDGKYKWLEHKRGGEWIVHYEGVYAPDITKTKGIKEIGAVIIADGPSRGGYLVRFEIISSGRLKGYWDTDASDGLSFDNQKDALFDYVRCGRR
jgi:hypothetical protein